MRKLELAVANKAVSFIDGCLHIGSHKVFSSTCKEGDKEIPALYMVRVIDERGYPTIVTGLDLMKSGLIWLGGYPIKLWVDQRQVHIPDAHYDDVETIDRILNTLCADTIGKEWGIYEEEDFEAMQFDQAAWQQGYDAAMLEIKQSQFIRDIDEE